MTDDGTLRLHLRQVDLLPLAPATPEHLAIYAAMDISLDPFPYAGTTTTCESLYMGAPHFRYLRSHLKLCKRDQHREQVLEAD